MAGRIKVKDEEDLSKGNILKVIALMESEKGITKKDACAMLQISYNTARLDKIITQFKEAEIDTAKRRADKRGTPSTMPEVEFVISAYLEGKPVSSISESIYRTVPFVKTILEKYGVPTRRIIGKDYFKPELIPDAAVRTRFTIGEQAYSARYDSVATIKAEYPPGILSNKTPEYVYRVYLEDESELQSAYQPASELASLEHITALGIKI